MYIRQAHTHAHRRLPETAGHQLHSESTKECIWSPSWQGGQGLCPLGPQAALPNCPASCQREGADDTAAAPEGMGQGWLRAVPAW